MAYEIFELPNARLEIRCAPGKIVHIKLDVYDDTWAVEEDPEHHKFRTRGDAIDRARFIGGDPDFR